MSFSILNKLKKNEIILKQCKKTKNHQKYLFIFLMILFSFSCASPGEQLKKDQPEKYNDIIGKWYILSPENPGELLYTISFNDDGSVSGDVSFFGLHNPHWTEKIYGGLGLPSNRVAIGDGWFNCKGCLAIYNPDSGNMAIADKIFYSNNKDEISMQNINPIYLNSIPPLKIMRIEFHGKPYGGKSFIFSRDLGSIDDLKGKSSVELLNEKKEWEKLNKNSVTKLLDFLQNVKNTELKSQTEESLRSLSDKKIISYLNKKYPQYQKYFKSKVSGLSDTSFYELMRLPILSIDHNTGVKIGFELRDAGNGNILLSYKSDKDFVLTLKPYKDNITVIGLKVGWQQNPRMWEDLATIMLNEFIKYPDWMNLDFDLLNKIN